LSDDPSISLSQLFFSVFPIWKWLAWLGPLLGPREREKWENLVLVNKWHSIVTFRNRATYNYTVVQGFLSTTLSCPPIDREI
jgi:hypothetical protein